MSVFETTYTPTRQKVEKKNSKYELSLAIMEIYRVIDECKDEETKQKIVEILLQVL